VLNGEPEVLCQQIHKARGTEKVLGSDYKKLYELVRGVSPKLENDRPLNEDIQRVAALLQSGEAQNAFGFDKDYESD
jgi:histidine ammonia-lyase